MSRLMIPIYVLAAASALVLVKLGSTEAPLVSIHEYQVLLNITLFNVAGLCLYVISFCLYLLLIARNDLAYIIPLTTGVVYVLIFFSSYLIFGEEFTYQKIAAIIMIIGGVTLLTRNGATQNV